MQEKCIVYGEPKQVISSYFNEPHAGLATLQICVQMHYKETAEGQRQESVLGERKGETARRTARINGSYRSYKAKKTPKC